MKFSLILFNTIVIVNLFLTCNSAERDLETLSCIEEKIEFIKNEPASNPPTKIYEWKVAGDTYYYITSDCCDQFNYLYTKNCELVCAPDGGFTGMGDGNCPDFNGEIEKTLIWEDSRK